MKKFAFILMGPHYIPSVHQAAFETENQVTYICTVNSFEEATKKILSLQADGVGAIELCGAFGKEKADELIRVTKHQIAIGYITHDPVQDPLFDRFFSK